MNKEQLAPWIEKLTKATAKEERTEIVAEMCKENGIKVGEGWKLLKEAGFDPKAKTTATNGAQDDQNGTGGPPSGDPPAPETGEDKGAQTGAGSSDIPPPPPPPPPPPAGKKRVRCEALKGKKITLGNGQIVQVDENGILEVDLKEAERLLTIPDYEEAD